MNKLNLKLTEPEISLLVNVISKELNILENKGFEKNYNKYLGLVDLKNYLIEDIIHKQLTLGK